MIATVLGGAAAISVIGFMAGFFWAMAKDVVRWLSPR